MHAVARRVVEWGPRSVSHPFAQAHKRPTIAGVPGPYRLFFYSLDCAEPAHVHVARERRTCKIWLERVTVARNRGFSARELNCIRAIVFEHRPAIVEAWNEHCRRAQ
ncbi:MAG: DUF4160 domain-containing protein [Gemmatimonadaceae bacterium]